MKALHHKMLQLLAPSEFYSSVKNFFLEFLTFGYKQALCCIFPVFIFVALAISNLFGGALLSRYDFLFLACVLAQVALVLTGIESRRELLVIMGFHLIGFVMEVHKVNVGSWTYPEEAFTKIAGVPLYSGFMYSSVASYICRAWENFDLKFTNWPKNKLAIPVGAVIYLNFFTNAYVQDIRWYIVIVLVIVFFRTKVHFTTNCQIRKMPLLFSFVLIGFFIWVAENIATFFGAWKYAYQHAEWQVVNYDKLSSWSLLVIVSIIIVAQIKQLAKGSWLKARSN